MCAYNEPAGLLLCKAGSFGFFGIRNCTGNLAEYMAIKELIWQLEMICVPHRPKQLYLHMILIILPL